MRGKRGTIRGLMIAVAIAAVGMAAAMWCLANSETPAMAVVVGLQMLGVLWVPMTSS